MKNYTDFKVGDRVLVKGNYATVGGEEFHKAMEIWKKSPVEIVAAREDGRVLVHRPGFNHCHYRIRMEDLIPFRTKNIFNK